MSEQNEAPDNCILHGDGFEEGCEMCAADGDRLNAQFQESMKKAQYKMERLNKQGGGIDPMSLIDLRLNTAIDMLFAGVNAKKRIIFETIYMQKMCEVLDEANTNIAAAKLIQGTPAQGSGRIITPGGRM